MAGAGLAGEGYTLSQMSLVLLRLLSPLYLHLLGSEAAEQVEEVRVELERAVQVQVAVEMHSSWAEEGLEVRVGVVRDRSGLEVGVMGKAVGGYCWG